MQKNEDNTNKTHVLEVIQLRKYFGGFTVMAFAMIAVIAVLNIFIYKPNIQNSKAAKDLSTSIGKLIQEDADRVKISEGDKEPDIEAAITAKCESFVNLAFAKDEKSIKKLLAKSAAYIKNKDGSSFIRHVSRMNHVEGYMATDKTLKSSKQKWYIENHEGTITTCVEIILKESADPIHWYLHFQNADGDWELFMLENDL